MARVQGVREKIHMPLYDAFYVPKESTFQVEMEKRDLRTIRFFVDVQNKTKLETNLQAAGVLPSLNTFEARALRVVISHIIGGNGDNGNSGGNGGNGESEAEVLASLVYSSVTTFLVGEKVMIEMPTFYFPAGAGVSTSSGGVASHGNQDPLATFRFAEPVFVEPQQNFRVEMLFPQGIPGMNGTNGNSTGLAAVAGPFRVWVVLDGYLTRDVQ